MVSAPVVVPGPLGAKKPKPHALNWKKVTRPSIVKLNLLILGASYGSLLGTKVLMAGHHVVLVCTRPTAELINREGTRVRFPIKGRESSLDILSKQLPGTLAATTPDEVDVSQFDLAVLAMQEAQYSSPGVRE